MTYPSKCTEPPCESVIIVLNQQTYQQSTDSVGVMICDAASNIIAACCKYLQGRYLVEEVEGLAMECGLLLAKEQMLSQIILESDSIAAVSGVLDADFGGCVGHIYQGICSILASFSN